MLHSMVSSDAFPSPVCQVFYMCFFLFLYCSCMNVGVKVESFDSIEFSTTESYHLHVLRKMSTSSCILNRYWSYTI